LVLEQTSDPLANNMQIFGTTIGIDEIAIIPGSVTKHEALEALIAVMGQHEAITDCEAFRRAVHERESIMSTGIGDGVAIPHVRIPEITEPVLGVGVVPEGVEYGTLDNQPVHVMVLFATPEGSEKEYLGLLAQVMLGLRNQELYRALVDCKTTEEVQALLNE
jgi:mannitol/fructose-specific phosphotransferase system IIA component (Ntr-type)